MVLTIKFIIINAISLCILVQNYVSISKFRTMVSVDQFFAFFYTLELNYTLTYASRGVRDLPQEDCLPDNLLFA